MLLKQDSNRATTMGLFLPHSYHLSGREPWEIASLVPTMGHRMARPRAFLVLPATSVREAAAPTSPARLVKSPSATPVETALRLRVAHSIVLLVSTLLSCQVLALYHGELDTN